VDGQKMSKSLGNFYTVKEVIEKEKDLKAIRFFLISVHYRQPLNFTWNAFKAAKEGLSRINYLLMNLDTYNVETRSKNIEKVVEKANEKFIKNMDDDLNISGAIGVLFDFVKEINKKLPISIEEAQKVKEFIYRIDTILGCLQKPQEEIPQNIMELAKKRYQARKNRQYDVADTIRTQINNLGYIIEDTPDGFRILKK
jgi:cysteinyl-tRNA synthetase